MRERPPDAADPTDRTLLILRHAKSAWDTETAGDLARPLAPRGELDAPRLGAWLAARGLVPDHVVCSPARRARQTAVRVLDALGAGHSGALRIDERLYGADLPRLRTVLADGPPDAERVLLVGHNPGLEILLRFLVVELGPPADRSKLLPTCTLAHLTVPSPWTDLAHGAATLRDLVRPKDL